MTAGAWDAMLEAESRVNDPGWAYEDYRTRNPRHFPSPSVFGLVTRTVWADAVRWVIQHHGRAIWDSLDERSALIELRKGEQSMFHAVFADDPVIFADCPRDGRVTVGTDGECSRCHFDFLK